MRQLLRDLAVSGLLVGALPPSVAAQQGSIRITAATHSVTGDSARTIAQPTFEPDLGISWLHPGRFGVFQVEIAGTTRDGQPHLGRNVVSLRDVKYGGVTYTFEAGDSFFPSKLTDHQFHNLYTPAITFSGVHIKAATDATEGAVMLGRATTLRNIFGTDVDTLDQNLFIARGTHRASERLAFSARASRVRTRDLHGRTFTIEDSDQAGGGARFVLTPAVHLLSDASVVRYRPLGSRERRTDGSVLGGVSVLLARGWLQMNASRFSAGELPILTQPLADRRTLYAAGEYDVLDRLRVFGGVESFEANRGLQVVALRQPTDGTRQFGGVRVRIGSSSAAVRIETGDRRSRLAGAALTRVSDTGAVSSEVQSAIGPLSTFARVAVRQNVQSDVASGTYSQKEASGMAFFNVNRYVQVFGSMTVMRNEARDGSGHTYWQAGGGTQARLLSRGLWLRAEGLVSRNVTLPSDLPVPRQTFSLGLNGEIMRHTTLALNVYGDRIGGWTSRSDSPWLVRSSVRVIHLFATGSTRPALLLGDTARHGGTGSIAGFVFTDWDNDGVRDDGEAAVANIPVKLSHLGTTTTSADGEFAFVNIPIGLQQVGIDSSSLPVDFDPPPVPQVQVQLARGETLRLGFGVVPLGSIAGRVVHDVNNTGTEDDQDVPLDGAVVVLNGGVRSEQARGGRFRFDAVRAGEHTVTLLQESLPDGSTILGSPSARVSIDRASLVPSTTFLVTIQTRPEIRRVFPAAGARPPTPAGSTRSAGATRPGPPGGGAGPAQGAALATSPAGPGRFAIQIAALNDPARAAQLAEELRGRGFNAYLVEPPPGDSDAPFRVRVGFYDYRAAAEHAAHSLEQQLGNRLWVVRER